MHPLDRLVRFALNSGLPISLFALALFAGALALSYTPREEEPQIVVPMVDVLASAPGLSASQVERQVTTPLEKLLAQIPGVEHVYSSSSAGRAAVTLRFFVGEDREESILNTYNKIHANQDKLPGVVRDWLIKPIEVDDVPIVVLALWSDDPERYSDFELRRLAEDISTQLQGIPQTSEVNVVGGRPRRVQILLNPEAMAAHRTAAGDIIWAIQVSNELYSVDQWTLNNQSIVMEAGDRFRSAEELGAMTVNVIDGVPISLQDVAEIVDGPAEADAYSWIDFAPGHPAYRHGNDGYPSVTISIAKQRGSNAVGVAQQVHAWMQQLQAEVLPAEIHYEVLRDYGQTADAKVNDLTNSLAFAVFTVVVFISVFLGWRQALVVGLAVPVCYGITLALDMALGYTINRVTLFALILSLGLLVDDPITGVDNISRYLKSGSGSVIDRTVAAMAEIRSPLLMSTLTIILAFIPLAFITGMMGPYMAPMAFNVPVSVMTSTLVAFLLTPWLSCRLLNQPQAAKPAAPKQREQASPLADFYRRSLNPLLQSRRKAKGLLYVVALLFIAACTLPVMRLVPLKLLPLDNKNEVQVVVDMPESSSLENTAALARRISALVSQVSEVRAIAAYVGQASPIDFNGMVRRYYQRQAPYMADLRLTLIDKTERRHQSHAVVLRLRELLAPLNQGGINIKVVEVPPGPPVLSTLVAEIYGSTLTPYSTQQAAARQLMTRMAREAHVTEVDSTVEDPRQRYRFVLDKAKAALSGVSTSDVNQALEVFNAGFAAGFVPQEREARPLPIELRLKSEDRESLGDFTRLKVKGRPGIVKSSSNQGLDAAPQTLVALGELGEFSELAADTAIFHKDLRPVVYVTAETNGRTPGEIIADISADQRPASAVLGNRTVAPTPWQQRNYLNNGGGDLWQLPGGTEIKWTGEGEWKITLDVFRDMGLAFGFALLAIFVVLRIQTASSTLSLIIMSAIPLTVIGIMPGFWLLNLFGEREVAGAPDPTLFTATAMIGMIALAGIVVRNSVILIEFISQQRQRGLEIKEALLQAGAIRMRPILLTAGTTLLGNLVITLDPVFSGLALAIIFGILASTLFTLFVVPIAYLLVFDKPATQENRRD